MSDHQRSPIAVLVVDDRRPFRSAARRMLDGGGQFVVVGEAESGEEAVEVASRLRPGLILMDVLLPGIDGIEATRQILAQIPDTVIVLVSTRRRAELPTSLNECGAVAFLQKELIDPETLGALVR
jgi:DNA-binding NarL/FixJ family response regulator